jgi:SWI/SNF related-matrix-associated actin-dependent regulator of chromatin subfamily C
MQNVYPIYEAVELEQIYGTKRESAKPPSNTLTYTFKTPVSEKCRYADSLKHKWYNINEISKFEKNSFPEMPKEYLKIRNSIIKMYENSKKYLTFKEVQSNFSNDKFDEVYKIYSFLNKLKVVNNRDIIEECVVILKSINDPDPENKTDLEEVNVRDLMSLNCNCGNQCDLYSKSRIVICKTCYDKGKYPRNKTSSDFYKINREFVERAWSKREEIKLLEAIEKYGDDWLNVSQYVGTKSKHDCIYHFMMIPILENNLNKIGFATHVPFMLSSNPVSHLLVFLSSVVHPSVAASVAKAATKEISNTGGNIIKTMLLEAKRKSLEMIELEKKKIIRLENVINESLANLIIMKIRSLKSLQAGVDKVKEELLEASNNMKIKEK